MRIPSGKVDQVLFFVAFDSSDHVTRKTGLSSFTVYRSRNGGTATVYTTPTVTELSSANMPGVYALLIDEDTTIGTNSNSEEYAVHITASGMDPVTRTAELYRDGTLAANLESVPRGTVTSGGSTTSIPTSALTVGNAAATGVVANQFAGRTVMFDGKTTTAGLRGAVATISSNTASNTPTLNVSTLPASPASGDTFSIV